MVTWARGPNLSGGLLFTAPVGTYPGAVSAAIHDGNGNVTGLRMGIDPADFSYGPFGEPVADDGPPKQPDFPFGFSTRYGDAETGLVYYGHRYYNPETGRWLNRDPLGEVDSPNLHAFVRNGPTISVDPLGEWSYTPGMGKLVASLGPDTSSTTSPAITLASLFSLEFYPESDRFIADLPCGSCRQIRFIQIYRSSFPSHYDIPFTWHVDAGVGPYYPNGVWNDPSQRHPLLGMGLPSSMQDVPHIAGGRLLRLSWLFQAETCAVCSKGTARGDVYGCLTWGHYFDLSNPFVPGSGRGVFRTIATQAYPFHFPLPGPNIAFDSYQHPGVTEPSVNMKRLILNNSRYSQLFDPE